MRANLFCKIIGKSFFPIFLHIIRTNYAHNTYILNKKASLIL